MMEGSKKRPHVGQEDVPESKRKATALPFETSRSGLKTLKPGGLGSKTQLSGPTTAQLTGAYMSSLASSPQHSTNSKIEAHRSILAPSKPDIKSNTSLVFSSPLPLTDYTIKRQVIVTSSRPFVWIDQPSSPWAIVPAPKSADTLSFKESFLASLLYYRYPDLFHPPSSDPTRAKVDLTPADQLATWVLPSPYVAQICQTWTQALQSSADLVLSQRGNSFFVCHQDWIFGCTSMNPSPIAYFNKTSLSLRKRLVQIGVSFVHPLLQISDDDGEVRLALSADPISSSASIDDSPSSQIVFTGHDNIQRLIKYLCQCCLDSEKWLGSCPPILSSKPFFHASLQHLTSTCTFSKLLAANGLVEVGTLVIQGVILPENFVQLSASLQASLEAGSSYNFNCSALKQSEWAGGAISWSSQLEAEASDANSNPLPLLNGSETILSAVISVDHFAYTCNKRDN